MVNLALYRKYRPQFFREVSGQDTIKRILKNQIKSNRTGHAYLFSGIRGTGKTSLAKIFAKAINCENPIDGEACGKCETCLALNSPGQMDIIEIDAASNRGVDEIRNLKETVEYPPSIGKFKVYIIDEVHMLTNEAFNALLKTLEEPPEHTVFIFATTEPNKLPQTILSRCQHFFVQPISDEEILNRLSYIKEKENINIDNEALREIVKRSGHSMRDAVSLLDQCMDLALPGEKITANEINNFLGITSQEALEKIVSSQINNNADLLISTLNDLRKNGKSDKLLIEDLLDYYKQLLYQKVSKEKKESLKDLDKIGIDQINLAIDTLLKAYARLSNSDLSRIITDSALLSLLQFEDKNREEIKLKPKHSQKVKEIKKSQVNSIEDDEIEESSIEVNKNSTSIKEQMIQKSEELGDKMINSFCKEAEFHLNKNGLFIIMDDSHEFMRLLDDFQDRLSTIVKAIFNKSIPIHINSRSEYEKRKKLKVKEVHSPIEEKIKQITGEDIIYEKKDE